MDYLRINRESWNNRVALHVNSDFYDVPAFLHGRSSLNDIELSLLGQISGKRVLHLQCHFGQDSLSMSRMGADVVGVDLSNVAIDKARALNEELGLNARFICCDVYELGNHLHEEFDIVFTSYGTIGWMPDLERWARIVSQFLKKGGLFVMVDFHPVVWMFDNDFQTISYSYFKSDPIVEHETGTYADTDSNQGFDSVTWNHSIGEILNQLISHQLRIQRFDEHDYSPYNCFRHTEEVEPGHYRIRHLGDRIPMVYAIQAVKEG